MKLKIIFFNNMHIGDTYLIQPFIKNIVDNNQEKYDFYYYVCYNYYIYDNLMNINNIIYNKELFVILQKNVDINECVVNNFVYKYLKDENILIIHSWYVIFQNKYNVIECYLPSYNNGLKNFIKDLENELSINIYYDDINYIIPFFPKFNIDDFFIFKERFKNQKIIFYYNYLASIEAKQEYPINNYEEHNYIIKLLSKTNIIILPNKEGSLVNEIKKYNLKNIYFADDEFNLKIDNSCKNLYYYAKLAHYCDIAIYFDTGKNFIYINNEFIDDYKNNKYSSLKLHFSNTGKYFSSLNLFDKIPKDYVIFIPIFNLYDLEKYLLINKIIDITDSLFISLPGGCGDFLYFVIISLLISNKYKNIYIYYPAIHFNTMKPILDIFINSNRINNIILLSNPEFTKDNNFYNYKKYFDTFSQNYNFLELININTNTYYSSVYDINKYETNCYFTHVLKLFNISIDDLFKIDFHLPDNYRILNDEYYNKVINKIGYEYIVVFNDPIHRFHDIFPIRQYQKEFNSAYYKIIYFTDQFIYNENEYNIKDLLNDNNDFNSIYLYNRIVENAISSHFISSYPAIYFNFIMNNINYKERFNNVQKNIYSRRLIGRNINNYNFNNIDEIDDINLILFSNFNAYYPLFFFRSRPDYEPKYYNDNGCAILYNSGYKINLDNNIFINPFKEDEKIYLEYFTKILQNNISSNKYGLSIYNSRFKNKNFIFLDLKEKTIQNHYIENLYDLDFIENQNTINQHLKENYLNIVFIKFDTIHYYLIKKRQLNVKNEIIHTDIEQPSKIYLKVIEHLINNKWVDYIFPYRFDEDKDNYINLLNS